MIFYDSLPYAKSFFAPLLTGYLALPWSTVQIFIRFLVASFSGLASAADASAAVRIDPRHRAQLVRFLARQRWSQNWASLTALAEALLQRCYQETGTWAFLLDQTHHTTCGKHSQNTHCRANKNKRPKKSNRRQKKTPEHRCHTFVFGLLISPQTGTRIPVVRSYYTQEYCRQRAATANKKNPAPTFKSQPDLAAEMIRQLCVPKGCPVLVLGDAAFEARQIQAACRERGFDWITPANSQRVLAGPKGKRLPLSEHCKQLSNTTATPITLSPGLTDWWRHQRGSRCKAWRGNYARRYWAQAESLNVWNVGTVQVAFSTTIQPQEGSPSEVQKILLSNRLDWDATQMVSAYSVRWQIEQFFREMKSGLGMSNYRVRAFVEVENWVQVCCIAFVYLEWYRLQCREESDRKEWWWRQRTHGLALRVRRQSEWADLLEVARYATTEEGREQLRAQLLKAIPLELRLPA